ncbi:MAG: ComF family protein [Pseudanabaenaceae cyanobacterium]
MALDRFLDLFLQRKCPLCGRSTPDFVCIYCSRALLACQAAQFCELKTPLPLFRWGVYDDALKRAIATCKYNHQPRIATFLGQQMGIRWQKEKDTQKLPKMAVVPIPLHPDKLKQRGFNQAELLARGFCDITSMPCRPDLLQRVKNTKPQMETKSVQARKDNLDGAFITVKNKTKQPILLVDDIYTSGATMTAAVTTLTQAGYKIGAMLVLARTGLHDR